MKTEQERIDYLANRIRNFRVAVSGGSDLLGGFGKIPRSGVTLDHLERSFKDFRLVGYNGLQARGGLKQGYSLWGGPTISGARGGTPPPAPCDPSITIELSGVSIDETCYNFGACQPFVCALQITDLGFNGTFGPDSYTEPNDWCGGTEPSGMGCFYTFTCGPMHWDSYCAHPPGDCSSAVSFSDDFNAFGILVKVGTTWYVQIQNNSISQASQSLEYFYAETTSIASPIANFLTGPFGGCSFYNRNNVLMDIWNGDCTPGSGAQDFVQGGSGGTIQINL